MDCPTIGVKVLRSRGLVYRIMLELEQPADTYLAIRVTARPASLGIIVVYTMIANLCIDQPPLATFTQDHDKHESVDRTRVG